MPARFAVIVPTYGEFPYVLKCLETLALYTSEYHCYFIDDCSPEWTGEIEKEIRRVVPAELLHLEHWEENRGLTAAWNHGLELARKNGHPYAALVNSDTLFTPGWLLRTAEALEKADLVGPLTNAPSDSLHQEIRRYVRGYRLDDSYDACAELSYSLRRRFPGRMSFGTINGFWMAAKTEVWWANTFDTTHVFNPKNRLTGNESEFEKRFKGRIASMHDIFIFHYRSVSRGLENVDPQYCNGAFRPANGAAEASGDAQTSELLSVIPKTLGNALTVGRDARAVGAALKERQNAKVVSLVPHPGAAYFTEDGEFSIEKLGENGPFEGLILSDVLEQACDPLRTLGRYTSLLSPGGVVIASLPNIRHLSTMASLLFEGRWPSGSGAPLRWFTRRNIEEIFEMANLRIERWEQSFETGDQRHDERKRSAPGLAIGPLREFFARRHYVLARK